MQKSIRTTIYSGLFLLFPCLLQAQGNSVISGKITDKKTGEPLIGVTVLITGTSQGAVSGIQGNYLIPGVSPGRYTITYKFLGYQSKIVSGIEVGYNRTITLDIVLDEAASEKLNEVIVTSTYQQESVNALYAARKQNDLVSDGISADQIRQSPDKNAAAVLQRISSASVEDNKFVVIRGLAARYNTTMMNGAVMPATEPDKKAFSFDVIPSDMIDNMIIYKTASPDHPGDAAGGTIQINTKDFPDRKLVSLSVGTGYQTQTTFKDLYKGYGNGKYDFLGFDDGSRSLPDAFKKVQSHYASLDAADKMEITRQFPNTFGGEKAGKSLPPLSMQFVAGNTRIMNNGNKLGYTVAADYSNNRTTKAGSLDQYLLSKEQLYHYNDNSYERNYNMGALLNAAYTFGKNKLSWKNFFSNEFQTAFTKRDGQVFDGADNITHIFSLNNEVTQNGLLNSVLAGEHTVGKRSINISWDIAYGLSYQMEPDQRILTVFQTDPGQSYYLSLSNENSPAIKNAGRIYSRLHENIYNGDVHLTFPFTYFGHQQKLKAGLSKTYRDRSFSLQALGYASDLDPRGGGATIALNKEVNLSNIFSTENLDRYKILLANIPQNTKDYTGTADLDAGYLMLENYFSSRWKLLWGVRAEHYRQQLISVNQPVQTYSYTDLLPSANLTWSVTDKTNLRLAYARTLNRPEFRELAAFRYYDYQHDFIISGNPDLQRSTNDNADLRIEYYPGAGEIISGSVFYKYFHHPIEQTNQGNNVLTYSNADNAVDYGIELEMRKRLNFLGENRLLKNIVIYANASFIRSNVTFDGHQYKSTLQGQSPYMINGGLGYTSDKNDFSFSVLYNRIGQRLQFRGENDGLDTYEKARDVLDLHISKKILQRRAEIRFTVSDMLAQPIVLYYKYNHDAKSSYNASDDRVISSINPGTAFSVSFKYYFDRGSR
jgi:TonB-dependent receptor